jgi:hypothetical protein
MSRGKSKNRKARIDIMRSNARRRAREYERQAYDKPVSHEGGVSPKPEGREDALYIIYYIKRIFGGPPLFS